MIKTVKPLIEYSQEKNLILKETRGVCFEDAIKAIGKDKILADIKHKNKKKYPNQKILVIKIKKYIYAIPYVINPKTKAVFFKTIYPSRVLTKKYLKKEKK